MKIPPCLSFAAFVFWLLAVPMDGPLPAAVGITDTARFFLPTHVLSLSLFGLFLRPRHFKVLAPTGVVLTAALTLSLFFRPALAPYLLSLLGFIAAFVTISACTALQSAARPTLSAAGGLVGGNLGLLLLGLRPDATIWHFLLTALPLLLILHRPAEATTTARREKLWHYLPLIFVYHVSSGLMYAFLFPAYQQAAIFPGLELFFYIAAALGAAWLTRNHRDLPLVCGIVLSMAAFALLQMGQSITVNLSMFAMQTGAGFVDLFLLAFLLPFPRPVRTFGLGLATLCLGIFSGQLISQLLGNLPQGVAMAGNLVLNLSLLSLYCIGRKQHQAEKAPLVPTHLDPPESPEPPAVVPQIQLPENIRLLLSQQEYLVLLRSLTGKTYRETASELTISESTVKTYMKRIHGKLGVSDRKELLKRLADF